MKSILFSIAVFMANVLFGETPQMIRQILVVKETRSDECRVALTPKAVSLLTSEKYRVLVESEAGSRAGFKDADYIRSGAEIFILSSEGFPENTCLVRVKRPSLKREALENKLLKRDTFVMGFLSPLELGNNVLSWRESRITTLSLDLFTKLSTQDSKNAQAAMSRIAGRLAFQDALKRYNGSDEIKLTVLGSGPAAFSAAFEAKKHGVPVQVFGRKAHFKKQLEQHGISYYVLPNSPDQINFIRSHLTQETIVVSAARVPGKKAPILIDEQSLSILPDNAVVVDLAVSEGGNVVGSKRDQVVAFGNGVSIVNISGYPKAEPREASEHYAQCLVELLKELISSDGKLLTNHELFLDGWLTYRGQCNPRLFEDFTEFEKSYE